jgi:SnoaL-like domain
MSAAPDAGFALWHALYVLEVRYWYDVDFNEGRNAHAFYTSDGVFAVGDNEFRGRDRIQQFYAWRGQRGLTTVRSLRTTRHLISNFWLEQAGDREARAFGAISFYEASGRPPVKESKALILIADIINICALDEDDQWRFKSHVLRPVFMGDDVPLSLAVDLTR